jgi:hypothetical protein
VIEVQQVRVSPDIGPLATLSDELFKTTIADGLHGALCLRDEICLHENQRRQLHMLENYKPDETSVFTIRYELHFWHLRIGLDSGS